MAFRRILPLCCCLMALAAPASAASIGQLDLTVVEPMLRDIVLSYPANQELKARVMAAEAREAAQQADILKKMEKGESIDHTALVQADSEAEMKDRDTLEDLIRGELLLIVERAVGKPYDLIFDSSYGSDVILTQAPIEDLTVMVQQYLLKQKAAANRGAAPEM